MEGRRLGYGFGSYRLDRYAETPFRKEPYYAPQNAS